MNLREKAQNLEETLLRTSDAENDDEEHHHELLRHSGMTIRKVEPIKKEFQSDLGEGM